MFKTDAQEHTVTPLEGYPEYSAPASLRSSATDGGTSSRTPVDASVDAPAGTPVTGPSLFTLSKRRKYGLFFCCSLLQFLLQFDIAAVAVTIPKIAEDEHAPQVKAFALATGYSLAQTVFQLVFSHMSHALGRKFMFLTGLSFWILGASISAGKVHIDALIGARVIQGIGAAGMFAMAAILVVEMTQPRQRAGWVAFSQAWGALGSICGPLTAGGMFRLGRTWNYVFAVEVALAGMLFLILTRLLPRDNRSLKERLHELNRCDWIGMGLFFACAVLLLVPINIGGTTETTQWNSAAVIVPFAVGFLSLVLLICHQRRFAERPAFPREVFARRPTTGLCLPFKILASIGPSIAFLCNAVCGILLFAVFYTLVIFWEGVRQKSAVKVGVVLLSMTITYPVAFGLTGLAIKLWGRIRPAIIVGALLSTTGLFCMQLMMTESTPEHILVIICLITGAGCGIFTPAVVNAVLALTDSRWHAHAIATRTLLYTAGQCIGVSLGMAIFTTAFNISFEAHDGDPALKAAVGGLGLGNPQELISNIKGLRELSPDGELVRLVTGALQWVWWFATIFSGVTGFLSFMMFCPDLPPDCSSQPHPPDDEQEPSSIEMASR